MSKLSKRLQTIADIVSGSIVCDVGCDHGLLARYLLDQSKVDFIYVSDISKPSLDKAINLLSNSYTNFEAICTNGLLEYQGIDKIDECIISGMGGNEIINIINSSPINIESYILSPQHNIIETKQFMLSNGYKIIFDIIIKDKDKFYSIFKCKKSNDKVILSKLHLSFGKDSFINKDSDIREYISYEENKLKKLLDKVDEKTKNVMMEKCELLNEAKKELKKYE